MTQRIENAINVLLDAYNNNTLQAGNCSACAVGNIVANAQGITLELNNRFGFSSETGDFTKNYLVEPSFADKMLSRRSDQWANLFLTCQKMSNGKLFAHKQIVAREGEILKSNHGYFSRMKVDQTEIDLVNAQIEATGFTKEELMKIEFTFESASNSIIDLSKIDEAYKKDQLVRLTAVVNLLLEMDNNTVDTVEEVFTSKTRPIEELICA